MKKVLTLALLSAAVILSACKKDDDGKKEPSGKGTVYVAGYQTVTDGSHAVIWKNGQQILLPGQNSSSAARGILISGNDIYVVGSEALSPGQPGNGVLWKNGQVATLQGNVLDCIATKDGIIYTGGLKDNKPTLWKGSEEINLYGSSSSVKDIFISGEDVYVLFNVFADGRSHTMIWKNGAVTEVEAAATKSVICNSIFVSGSDVYVAGQYDNNPVYWKNDVMTKLTTDIAGTANKIVLSGSDLYIAGTTNAGKLGVLWKNGEQTAMDSTGSISSCADVFIKGDDVYVAGLVTNSSSKRVAMVWKNGQPITLGYDGSGSTSATAIWVK